MAGSLNKVMLIGNLGADPEIRSFQNGGKVANLRIATSETWKDRVVVVVSHDRFFLDAVFAFVCIYSPHH